MPQAEGVHFQRAEGPVVWFFIPQSGITNSLPPLSEANITRRRQAATTFGAKGPVKLTNPWTEGPSILRTLFMQPFYTTRGASRAPFFKIAASAATTTTTL